MKKQFLGLLAIGITTFAHSATEASGNGQDWGPMPWPTVVNEPTIRDFQLASRLIESTVGEKGYADRFTTYRMCTELALRNLPTYQINPVGAMVYTAVRGCTRQMDNYVLLFVQDPRFKADYYVSHAIQRIAQQDQQIALLPLAERLQRPVVRMAAPGIFSKFKDFFNIDSPPKREEKVDAPRTGG